MKTRLKGITWNHSRGFVSVTATAQRFSELYPDVEIEWEKRSLQEFADAELEPLAEKYDLLIIDHPWAGFAREQKILHDLNNLLPAEYLADQQQNSVGRSFESYCFDGFQCALPIDAASPIATYREDLLTDVPASFDEVLDLARDKKVLVPAKPIDSLMNFFMLHATLGGEIKMESLNPFDEPISISALTSLKKLTDLCPPEVLSMNPIAVYEAMSTSDDFVYCPFAYGYSTYSMPGYAKKALKATPLVSFEGKRLSSTLGGTGIAISAKTKHPEIAAQFVQFTCSPEVQSTIYVHAGGQPGHRAAWVSKHTNSLTDDFFSTTLPDLDESYLRPRFSGYTHFQDAAGAPVHQFLLGDISVEKCVALLNQLFVKSYNEGKA